MTNRLLFYLVILLQAMFLVMMTGSYYAIDVFGKEIQLRTEPIDPRDIFYGDYVVMQYNISSVSSEFWLEAELPQYGDQVWVLLEKEDNYHEVVSVGRLKPIVGSDMVLLRGKYMYEVNSSELLIKYGIERYYVPEGTGKKLEEEIENLVASIRVAPWGQLKIEKVEVIEDK